MGKNKSFKNSTTKNDKIKHFFLKMFKSADLYNKEKVTIIKIQVKQQAMISVKQNT